MLRYITNVLRYNYTYCARKKQVQSYSRLTNEMDKLHDEECSPLQPHLEHTPKLEGL